MGALIAVTVFWIVLALIPFPFAGLPRSRFAVGLLGSLGLAGETLVIAGFLVLLGGYHGDTGPSSAGYHWSLLLVAVPVAVLGLVGVWLLVRAQWSAMKAHTQALR
jgi:hypothetical protein